MAIVKCLPVSTAAHLHNLIDYVQQDNKTMKQEYVYCSGCQLETAYDDFKMIKKITGKTGGILAHQIVQSFVKGEVDVEKAHRLSCEFAERTLTGYQYTVCTHVDKDHIHSHIVLNSVNNLTGNKYHSNLKSLAVLQNESDRLCKEYGLSVITDRSGYRALDKTTYELAKKGNSWKVKLSNVLDNALSSCRSKAEFNTFMKEQGYQIFWTNKNITVQYKDYKIRLDTLAKQLGEQYIKTAIENALHIIAEVTPEKFTRTVTAEETDAEFFRCEKELLDNSKTEIDKLIDVKSIEAADKAVKKIKSQPRLISRILAQMKLIKQRYKKGKISRPDTNFFPVEMPKLVNHNININTQNNPKITIQKSSEYLYHKFGNISKGKLIHSIGDTAVLKIRPTDIPRLAALGIFYSGGISSGGTKVYFKAAHSQIVSVALGIDRKEIKTVQEIEYEKKYSALLRQRSITEYKELYRINFSVAEIQQLAAHNIVFSYYRDKDKYKTVFFREQLKEVCAITGKEYPAQRQKMNNQDNQRIYISLKAKAARILGESVQYRIVDENVLSLLKSSNIEFAYFQKQDKYNVAMLNSSLPEYQKLLKQHIQQPQPEEQREQDNGKTHHL